MTRKRACDPPSSEIPEMSSLRGPTAFFQKIWHRFFGKTEAGENLRQKLQDALREEEGPAYGFTSQERAMLRNILRFGCLRVADVMVPRADIQAIEESAPVSDLIHLFERAGHSRIPVYRDTLDDPQGMIHIKDLLRWLADQSREASTNKDKGEGNAGQARLRLITNDPVINLGAADLSTPVFATRILRKVLFVPPSMSVVDLLLRMQGSRMHMALVVDEYGGTDGLVSIEDLVEEIVGEIEDEHDVNGGPLIRAHPDGGYVASARAPVSELSLKLGFDLVSEDEDVDTLGGLVFMLAGRVPVKGEIVRHPSGVEFEVLEADPRRIRRLHIRIPAEKATPSLTPRRHGTGGRQT